MAERADKVGILGHSNGKIRIVVVEDVEVEGLALVMMHGELCLAVLLDRVKFSDHW